LPVADSANHNEGDLVAADFAFGDFRRTALADDGSGELASVHIELIG
jgi:hypothetical protein